MPQLDPIPANNYESIITGGAGIYYIDWPHLDVRAKIDRITEGSGEIKAEVKITSGRPDGGHLRAARLNLTSLTSRNAFAKSLLSRDKSLDWDLIIEAICIATLDEFRQGSPVVALDGTLAKDETARWVVQDLIQTHNPTLVYGPGASGKSFLAQFLATIISNNITANAAGLQVQKPLRTLYLDYETDEAELDGRLAMIRRGLGIEASHHNILYRSMTRGLADDVENLQAYQREHGIEFLIIDSMNAACGGEPENARTILNTFNALKSIVTADGKSLSSLIIDHTNRNDQIYGSESKRDRARLLFRCKKAQADNSDRIQLGLFLEKTNNTPMIKPMGFEILFNGNSITVKRQDIKTSPLEEYMKIPDRIANALSRYGKLSAEEIAEEIGKEESHVKKELSYGKKAGKFIQLADRKWALPARRDDIVRETYQRELEGEI